MDIELHSVLRVALGITSRLLISRPHGRLGAPKLIIIIIIIRVAICVEFGVSSSQLGTRSLSRPEMRSSTSDSWEVEGLSLFACLFSVTS